MFHKGNCLSASYVQYTTYAASHSTATAYVVIYLGRAYINFMDKSMRTCLPNCEFRYFIQVAQRLVLLPQSKNVLGSIPS